jgi:hypothetical protein
MYPCLFESTSISEKQLELSKTISFFSKYSPQPEKFRKKNISKNYWKSYSFGDISRKTIR